MIVIFIRDVFFYIRFVEFDMVEVIIILYNVIFIKVILYYVLGIEMRIYLV